MSTRVSDRNTASRRLFTVSNSNFKTYERDDKPLPYQEYDMLHLSTYGLKKICTDMKFGLYIAFNLNPPVKGGRVAQISSDNSSQRG